MTQKEKINSIPDIWIERLKEAKVYTKFIKNFLHPNWGIFFKDNEQKYFITCINSKTWYHFLNHAFNWSRCPEGFGFWANLADDPSFMFQKEERKSAWLLLLKAYRKDKIRVYLCPIIDSMGVNGNIKAYLKTEIQKDLLPGTSFLFPEPIVPIETKETGNIYSFSSDEKSILKKKRIQYIKRKIKKYS